MTQLLRAEIRRKAAARILSGPDRATAAGSEPLAIADLQREVNDVRNDRRSEAPQRPA